jgi:hypothetical protein
LRAIDDRIRVGQQAPATPLLFNARLTGLAAMTKFTVT